MDLKIEDVSELLRVSEATIRRWVKNKQIPSYKLNQQHRFNRLEIENWMLHSPIFKEKDKEEESTFSTDASGRVGSQQFGLFRAIHNGDVLVNVPGKTKQEVICNVAQVAAIKLALDPDLVTELLLDRENLLSTALNHGIAVPHPRELIAKGVVDRIIVAFPEAPIDFGAMDGIPVHTLFFLFSSQDKRHLHLLAKIAYLSSQPKALEFLSLKPSKEECLTFIKSWEGSFSS
ncbi:MAG: helix-turn-helix domain-containing protein [Chlamydiae bacterium]|jgi:PTS system nitrogen regulatory IIA component|nr:helix-turn-helix domain-containing protein [Chlamydiota bacterium]